MKYGDTVNTLITMMTFRSNTPRSCGMVALDANGIVQNMYEKVSNPPTDLANGAVYLIEPSVLDWLTRHPHITDFSTEVIPSFLGRIATWENKGIHRDIGVVESLVAAQKDAIGTPFCITVDHQTLEDNTVTLRDRDTMEQERISVEKLHSIIAEKVNIGKYLES